MVQTIIESQNVSEPEAWLYTELRYTEIVALANLKVLQQNFIDKSPKQDNNGQ